MKESNNLIQRIELLQTRADSSKNDIQIIAKHLKLAQTKITAHEEFVNNGINILLEEKMNLAIQKALDEFQKTIDNKLDHLLKDKVEPIQDSVSKFENRFEEIVGNRLSNIVIFR